LGRLDAAGPQCSGIDQYLTNQYIGFGERWLVSEVAGGSMIIAMPSNVTE